MHSVVFKLTDFGAAKELAEGDEFTSMYGTEEYLVRISYLFYNVLIPDCDQSGRNKINTNLAVLMHMYVCRDRGSNFAVRIIAQQHSGLFGTRLNFIVTSRGMKKRNDASHAVTNTASRSALLKKYSPCFSISIQNSINHPTDCPTRLFRLPLSIALLI
jgi:hypothetical protein